MRWRTEQNISPFLAHQVAAKGDLGYDIHKNTQKIITAKTQKTIFIKTVD